MGSRPCIWCLVWIVTLSGVVSGTRVRVDQRKWGIGDIVVPDGLLKSGEVLTNGRAEQCVPLNTLLPGASGRDVSVLVRRNGGSLEIVSTCEDKRAAMLFSSSDAKTINESSVGGNGTTSGRGLKDIQAKVWISSTVAIVIISAVGLLGVAIVPLMQKVFYNHIIQFLVALAVGSLTGDAMLHLLPHAITGGQGDHGHDENEENERQAIFKGLVALAGLYFFFIAEKLVAIVSEYRAEMKAEEEERRKAAQASRKPSTLNDWKVVEEQRRRSRCENAVTVGLSSQAMKSIDTIQRYRQSEEIGCFDDANTDENATEGSRLTCRSELTRPSLVEYRAGNGGTSHDPSQRHSVRICVPESESQHGSQTGLEMEKPQVLLRPDNERKREAGHGHGHSHEVPDSIASVAWMVILGDGLHNFTDGLAIGAAFAKDFTGGLSTSIAVFCHELPHELGDFAVLLTTGMSVKQALFYNIISSVLCLIGMFIGIALGNVESASYWIFAITAGIFIYIALVDMLPELSSINAKAGESRLSHFVIQNCGIMTGVGIMLVIAMFEENIKSAFD